MGYLLANGNWSPPLLLMVLVLTSAFLYTAGMILNDVFDYEVDSKLRPTRPLPSQQINLTLARSVGFGFLAIGLCGSLLASLLANRGTEAVTSLSDPRPIVIGGLLVVFICLYNVFLKRTFLSPVAMGVCRGLNVLLGASTATASTIYPNWLFGFASPVWIVALSLGVLISGVTWFARNESVQSRPLILLPAGAMLLLGITGIALTPIFVRCGISASDRIAVSVADPVDRSHNNSPSCDCDFVWKAGRCSRRRHGDFAESDHF